MLTGIVKECQQALSRNVNRHCQGMSTDKECLTGIVKECQQTRQVMIDSIKRDCDSSERDCDSSERDASTRRSHCWFVGNTQQKRDCDSSERDCDIRERD
jgi:hypothetical protein